MKKLFAMLLAATLFWGCSKTTVTDTASFIVNGIHDVTLTNNVVSTVALPLNIQNQNSAQETVTLAVSGLPNNVVVQSGFVSSGIPTYATVLTLVDNVAVPGVYPITLTATGSVSGAKTYSFNLTVNAETDCSSQITGNYINSVVTSSTSGSSNYTDNVTSDGTVVNKVWFSNFLGSNLRTLDGKYVYGIYNCGNNTISIPYQEVYWNGDVNYPYHIAGNGTTVTTGGVKLINLNMLMNGYSYTATMQ